MSQSKQNFKSIILKHYLCTHIPLTSIVALSAIFSLHQTKLPYINSLYILILIFLVVILETIRSFLRLFMYTALQTKTVVFLETSTFLGFVLSVWAPFLIFQTTPSFQSIFITHSIESAITATILTFFVINFYSKLPSHPIAIPDNLSLRMFKTKTLNYILRLSRELFSTHFLTPFFALRFGVEYAGIFYFSTVLAHSLQSIFKVSVGYMGNALFATLKNKGSADKQFAFSMLCHKMSRILIPITIFLLINLNNILKHALVRDLSTIVFVLPLLFFFILIVDFTISIYEQLYISEEAAGKFLGFKILEFLLFILLISLTNNKTPIPIFLVGIILIKALCFALISSNAFNNWKVKPQFNTNVRQIAIYTILSILLSLAL